MKDNQAREILISMGYVESTFDQYEKDTMKMIDNGFIDCQTACIEHNLKNYLPSVIKERNVKKFYIVKMANKISDVRAWGWMD